MAGLRDVLRAATGDPTVEVVAPWDAAVPQTPGRAVVGVPYAPGRTAYVLHRASTLNDPAVVRVVQSAVALTARNLDARAELARQTRVAADARDRAVAARDRQRREVAQRLSADVMPHLDAALDALATDSGERSELIRETVAAARAEVLETVVGTAPAHLGRGGLVRAVRERCAAYDLPVIVDATAWQGADGEAEETLFYVCSEAVVNAVKHSGASRVTVFLCSPADEAVAIVADDGRGGADPSGHGLTGLADRVAARGGRLRVASPSGAGTVVTAVLPLNRSSSTD
jgi:signal transduction histidine kinase